MNPRRITLYLLFIIHYSLFIIHYSNGQGIPIGKWRDHLPYNNCISIAVTDNNVYCATPYCLFYYNKNDNSLNRLNNINGLSDFGVSTIKYSSKFKLVLVAYTDANIDIIDNNGNITNFSDIKRKQILGNKTINRITFLDNYAYLSCGFGIVVFDLVKMEIEDTYYIGPNGNAINVYDVASNDTTIYAATEKGIFTASLSGANLADFNSWTRLTIPDPAKTYNCLAYFDNKIFANQSNINIYNGDTVFVLNGKVWSKFKPESGKQINSIDITNNFLIFSAENNIDIFDSGVNLINQIYNYVTTYASPSQAIFDKDNTLWVADKRYGLIKYQNARTNESIFPNGPATNYVYSMACAGGNLWVTTGSVQGNWSNAWLTYGVYLFTNEQWTSFNQDNGAIPASDNIYDYISVGIDPLNTNLAYIGTWSKGLMMFKNNQLYKFYDTTNSSLRPFVVRTFIVLRVGGIHFDQWDNMWVTNPGSSNPISVRTPGENGAWQSFAAPGITTDMFLSDFVIDSSDQKWIIIPRSKGILVFTDNGTINNPADDQYKILSNNPGLGNLPSKGVYSIALDYNGEVWVGTDQGIAVFYSPADIFTSSPSDAQQILVNQNGHWEYLLQTETVTAIAVDGANRKWFGTQNSGVYLMSSDGTQQIEHFDTDNSPLFSNTIMSIAINQQSGEVFFGTSNGIISYRGTATQGADSYANKSAVYAYPNPVKEDYDGPVAIKGLVTDSDVKITSITGNLIYHTIALGGQAIWDVRNYDGTKAHSGVYLVFCSNSDGSETLVTKILVIR